MEIIDVDARTLAFVRPYPSLACNERIPSLAIITGLRPDSEKPFVDLYIHYGQPVAPRSAAEVRDRRLRIIVIFMELHALVLKIMDDQLVRRVGALSLHKPP